MDKKRVLILGASGFIGKNLARFLNLKDQEFEVIGVGRSQLYEKTFVYYRSNLTYKNQVDEIFESIRPDIVIHTAAITTGSKDVIEKPYLHVTDNTIMNALILEACHRYNVKHTIFMSCTVMYQSSENRQSETDWKIEDKIYPCYFGVGNMKVYTEKLCEFYSTLSSNKYTAIRHSNIYGPEDKFDLDKCHLVPAMIRKIYEAKNELEIWGDGTAKRDILYIDDLLSCIYNTILYQTNKYELFNCGYGKAFSIQEIIDVLKELTNKQDLKLIYNTSKPNIPTTVVLNCDKAKDILNWIPRISLRDGLQKTLEWYKINYDINLST